MPTTVKITGILLAAGLSTRMGEPKQLLPFGNSTIVETIIDNMIGSKLDEVIVVIGHESERVNGRIRIKPVKVVFNPNYKQGMLTSAQCGVQALSECADAFALMLVDQPFITSDLINRVVDSYKDSDKEITLPSHNYRRGHPAIFNRRYASHILSLDAESGGIRSLFKKNANFIHYVIVDTDRVLKDIDYRKDYEEALQSERMIRQIQ